MSCDVSMNTEQPNENGSATQNRQPAQRHSMNPIGMKNTTFITSCSTPYRPVCASWMNLSKSSWGSRWCVAQNRTGSSGIGYSVNATRPSAYSTARYADSPAARRRRWSLWYSMARIGNVSTADANGHRMIASVNDSLNNPK